jgi:flagellar motor protein MotB
MRWSGAVLLMLLLLMLVSVACAPARSGPPDCGVPTDGHHVVIEVGGTSHDPRPSLTSRALDVLRAAAGSDDARNGRGARGSVALVVSTDSTARRVLPLTPRRDNCEVEHGLQRDRLIHTNLGQVLGAVATTSAATPGLDLLAGTDNAVRGLPPGTLIVVGNALGTAGGFDLRQIGWTISPQDLVRQLNERGLLRDMLTGWRVLFIGVGEAAGGQPPVTKPTRDTLLGYLCAIVRTAGAVTCDVDQSPLDAAPPASTVPTPAVDVPGVTSAVGPNGSVTTALDDTVLGFTANSAELGPDARAVLHALAVQIAARSPGLVTIRGYVADPPVSTPSGRRDLAERRADVVAGVLRVELGRLGVSPRIDAVGVGAPSGQSAVVNGSFDEDIARGMRKVSITY